MAYTFYKKEKRQDRGTMYIAYMMMSSFFKKIYVSNKIVEKQLFLYYREMNTREQERKEKRMLQDLEHALQGEIGHLKQMYADVHFMVGDQTSHIYFDTAFDLIHVEVYYNGEYRIDIMKAALQ